MQQSRRPSPQSARSAHAFIIRTEHEQAQSLISSSSVSALARQLDATRNAKTAGGLHQLVFIRPFAVDYERKRMMRPIEARGTREISSWKFFCSCSLPDRGNHVAPRSLVWRGNSGRYQGDCPARRRGHGIGFGK
jgi:hypothetical protein